MPILHSGTFNILFRDEGFGVILSNFTRTVRNFFPNGGTDNQDAYLDQANGVGAIVFSLVPGHANVVTSADGTFDVGNAPPGFTPSTSLGVTLGGNFTGDPTDSFTLEDEGVASSTAHGGGSGFAPVLGLVVALPDNRSWALLSTDLFKLTVTFLGTFGGFQGAQVYQYPDGVGGHLNNPGLQVVGNYDIVAYWWLLPDTTPCGDKNTVTPDDSKSHLVLSSSQPPTPTGAAGDFARLGADDAAPTPIILTIEPNHGQAGEPVKIKGSGFGDDATVTVDGVDALDVVVVNQYEISCTMPAHALGFASVVVTNPDGVSS